MLPSTTAGGQVKIVEVSKTKDVLSSRNFFVTLINLVLLAFAYNNLPIDVSADVILDTISAGDLGAIVGLIVTNLLNPILRIISGAGWSWGFLKSANFWTQALTVLLGVLATSGIMFPDGAAGNIVGAVGGPITVLISMLFINLVNPLLHFFTPAKPKAVTEDGEVLSIETVPEV